MKVFLATLYVNYVDTVALSVADLWLFGQISHTCYHLTTRLLAKWTLIPVKTLALPGPLAFWRFSTTETKFSTTETKRFVWSLAGYTFYSLLLRTDSENQWWLFSLPCHYLSDLWSIFYVACRNFWTLVLVLCDLGQICLTRCFAASAFSVEETISVPTMITFLQCDWHQQFGSHIILTKCFARAKTVVWTDVEASKWRRRSYCRKYPKEQVVYCHLLNWVKHT